MSPYFRQLLSCLVIALGLLPFGRPPAMAASGSRVAILPFSTPVNRPDLEQYGLGTMDTLIQALANVPQFVMVDRGRIESILREQHFAQTGMVDQGSAVAIGKIAGAQLLVTGNLVQAGDKVRITAHFTDMTTGQITKSAVVTGALNGIFDLMDQLAQKFLAEQGVEVTQQQQQRIAAVTKSTSNINAYDYYLKGRVAFQKFSVADLQQAIEFYNKAIGVDQRYALAYAGLSEAWSYLGLFKVIASQAGDSDFQEAYKFCKKALAINPDLPEALRALALVGPDSDDPIGAIKKVLALQPNDAETWFYYYMKVGLPNGFPPDHEYLIKALQLNPDLILAHLIRGVGIMNKGDYNAALAEFREVLRVNPDQALAHFFAAGMAIQQMAHGQVAEDQKPRVLEEAIRELRDSERLDPNFAETHNVLAILLKATGHREEAIKEWEETLRVDPNHKDARQMLEKTRNGG